VTAAEVVGRIAPTGGAVHVHCADPGAFALLDELEPTLRVAGMAGVMFVEGWALSASCGRCVPFSEAALRAAAAPGDTLLLGVQVDFARTRLLIRLCRKLEIASVLVFDHWKNYTEHFLGTEGPVLPDAVLLPDELGRETLLARFAAHAALRGYDPDRAAVLGHPAMERSVAAICGASEASSKSLLRSLGVEDRPVAALFLDPVVPEDGFGYDVATVLDFIGRWMDDNRPGVRILVKPHPRQTAFGDADLAPLRDRGVVARTVSGPFEPLTAAADEIWGMTSLVLVAALKAGKPVISFQPGRTALGRAQSNPYLEPWVII
jgi:hypothetical protein